MKKLVLLAICLTCMHWAFAHGWNRYQVSSTENEITVEIGENIAVSHDYNTDESIVPLMVFVVATPDEIVLGESLTLEANASGGTGNYSYSWEPQELMANPNAQTTTATPTEAGVIEFSATVNDGVSTASMKIEVVVYAQAPVTCPQPNQFSGTNYYEDGEFGAHLMWDRADYEFTLDRFEIYRSDNGIDFDLVKRIVNTPSISHYECDDEVTKPGLYYYRIIAFYQNDCESEPVEITVDIIDYTSVGENLAENVAVYPNPASGKVTVKGEKMRQVSVLNTMGQVVALQNVDSDNVMIDMSAFDSGTYIINIMTENGNISRVLNVLKQ